MAFTPESPEEPTDLMAMYDDTLDEVAVLLYVCDQGSFYRDNAKWVAILDTDETTVDLEGLVVAYVTPAFIPVYDEAEKANEAIDIDEVHEYEVPQTETE